MWPNSAYKYYTNSLKVEVSQSHPVLKAFCGLLLDIMVENGPIVQKIRDAEEGTERSRAINHKQPLLLSIRIIFTLDIDLEMEASWNVGMLDPQFAISLWTARLFFLQVSRRTGAAKLLHGGESAVAGSCSTRWSTTPRCWVPGSTSRRSRKERTSSTGSLIAALWKAARRMRRNQPPRPRQTRFKMREIRSEVSSRGFKMNDVYYLVPFW